MADLAPIAAFDIAAEPLPLSDPWPGATAARGYRWLHLDLADPALPDWTAARLPVPAARALLQTETRPRCDRLGEGLILNLRGVNLNPGSDPEDMVSLRMWVAPGGIVSVRARRIFAVDAIRAEIAAGHAPADIGRFLAELVQGLTDRIETVSLRLEDRCDELEDLVFAGGHARPGEIGELRAAVIQMRRFVNPQREAVAALAGQDGWLIGPHELAYLRENADRTRRIVEELDSTRDRLSALHDRLAGDRALAIARNGYVLSVIAAIFLPLGFLTGLFGVNLAGMPGAQDPNAFWWLVGGSALLGIALFVVFKFARWL